MRIRIEHETRYTYEEPVRTLLQVLRMTPRSHVGQHVLRWRIEPSIEGALRASVDSLGNLVHHFAADAGSDALAIRVSGEVETDETHGVVRGAVERAPELYWLRETALTAASDPIRAFAEEVAGAVRAEPLAALHRLNAAIHERVAFDTQATSAVTSAAEAFAAERGVCQDLAHVFIAAARHFGIPARYVSGYLCRSDGVVEQEAAHGWAEARAEGLGWVAFDPAHGLCATPAHVRVAIGLDYLGASPIRGSRYGGGSESLDVRLSVSERTARDGRTQTQTQSQSQA